MKNTPDLENNEFNDIEVNEVIEEISLAFIDGDITDNNPSLSNGLTTLDQLIILELKEYISQDLPVDIIKAKIKLKAWELEKDLEGEISNENIELKDTKFDNIDEDQELNLKNPYIKEMILKIAKHILAGNITTDNSSPFIELNSAEQIIYYKFYDYCYSELDLVRIVDTIQANIKVLNGGSNLSDFYIDPECLNYNLL